MLKVQFQDLAFSRSNNGRCTCSCRKTLQFNTTATTISPFLYRYWEGSSHFRNGLFRTVNDVFPHKTFSHHTFQHRTIHPLGNPPRHQPPYHPNACRSGVAILVDYYLEYGRTVWKHPVRKRSVRRIPRCGNARCGNVAKPLERSERLNHSITVKQLCQLIKTPTDIKQEKAETTAESAHGATPTDVGRDDCAAAL